MDFRVVLGGDRAASRVVLPRAQAAGFMAAAVSAVAFTAAVLVDMPVEVAAIDKPSGAKL